MGNHLVSLAAKGTSLKHKSVDVVLLLQTFNNFLTDNFPTDDFPTDFRASQAQTLQSSKSYSALPSTFLEHLVFVPWNTLAPLYVFKNYFKFY